MATKKKTSKEKTEKLGADEPKTFEEFTQAMVRALHDSLIQEGVKGMRTSLYVWLPYYGRWIKRI